MSVEQIRDAIAEREEAALVRAKAEALKAMNAAPTSKNIAAFEKATSALERYYARKKEGADQILENTLAVVEYLQKKWKVSQSKVYADVKAGKLVKHPDGHFLAGEVDRYAETHLEKPVEPIANVQDRKNEAAARRMEIKAEEDALDLAKKKGELIEVEKVHAELASRAQVLKADLINLAHAEASALARMTDPEAITRHLVERIETFLDRYASDEEFVAELTA